MTDLRSFAVWPSVPETRASQHRTDGRTWRPLTTKTAPEDTRDAAIYDAAERLARHLIRTATPGDLDA